MSTLRQSWKHEQGLTRVIEVHSYLGSNIDVEFERDGKYLRLHVKPQPKQPQARTGRDRNLLDPLPLEG